MLAQIAELIKIGAKFPPPVYYFYMPPQPQWVPDVALKKIHQTQGFWLSIVGLHNLSSRVLSSIRIKLPIGPTHEPVISTSGVGAAVGAKYESQVQEVQIQKLDPGEQIYIMIFLSNQEFRRFTEPQVIVNDRLLSRGTRTVGFIKKNPKDVLPIIGAILFMLSAIVFVGYMVLSPINPKVKAVQESAAIFKQFGCELTAYEKSRVNESLLAKHRLGEPSLLQLNRVVTREALFDKDYVVICE